MNARTSEMSIWMTQHHFISTKTKDSMRLIHFPPPLVFQNESTEEVTTTNVGLLLEEDPGLSGKYPYVSMYTAVHSEMLNAWKCFSEKWILNKDNLESNTGINSMIHFEKNDLHGFIVIYFAFKFVYIRFTNTTEGHPLLQYFSS